jgi:hypothetical protein
VIFLEPPENTLETSEKHENYSRNEQNIHKLHSKRVENFTSQHQDSEFERSKVFLRLNRNWIVTEKVMALGLNHSQFSSLKEPHSERVEKM